MPFNAHCPGCGSSDPCGCSDPYSDKTGSTDVKYIGPNLSATGIATCDTLTVALQKIDNVISILQEAIFPTTTTTTTTNSFPSVRYGMLYNGKVILDSREISSSNDWLVPSVYDGTGWETFGSFPSSIAGSILKQAGTLEWQTPNTGATNSSEMNIIPGGWRWNGVFENLGTSAYFNGDESSYVNGFAWFNYDSSEMTRGSGFGEDPFTSLRLFNPTTSLSEGSYGIYIGNDGRNYPTKVIDGKEWMLVNLAETKYRNGDWINGFNDGVYTPVTGTPTVGTLCYYNDDINLAFFTS